MNRAWLLTLFLLLPAAVLTEDREVVEVEVKGMSCPFCVYGVQKRLERLPGVERADVDLKAGRARIVMDRGEKVDAEQIKEAITESGFTPGEVSAGGP